MAHVEIYTNMLCGYCAAAKRLLTAKGVSFQECDVLLHPAKRQDMIARAQGRHTVPQIFINGEHIGGYAELLALESVGALDAKLGHDKPPTGEA